MGGNLVTSDPGIYVLGFTGDYDMESGIYAVEEDGSKSYFRHYYEVEMTFDHSGTYIVPVNW